MKNSMNNPEPYPAFVNPDSLMLELDQVMLAPASLCIVFDYGRTNITERIKEFREWIAKGRYPKTSIIEDGKFIRVNRYAFHDFLSNRYKLSEKNTAKYVEPYNPVKLAMETGYIRISHRKKTGDINSGDQT